VREASISRSIKRKLRANLSLIDMDDSREIGFVNRLDVELDLF